jgi:O-antigen ligase
VLATVLSFSRGGFVGLIAVVAYSWFKSPRKLLSIIIVVFLLLIVIFSAPQEYWDRINSITAEGMDAGTGAERLFFWKLAVEMFKDHPIMGVGQGNFPYNIRYYQPPDGYYGRSMSGMQAHSIYFTIISELGIIGIIIFVPLFFVSIRDIRSISLIKDKLLQDMVNHYGYSDSISELYKLKYLSMGLLAAYIGYMVCGVFLSVLHYPHLWILLALSVAMKRLESTITISIEYSNQNMEANNNF